MRNRPTAMTTNPIQDTAINAKVIPRIRLCAASEPCSGRTNLREQRYEEGDHLWICEVVGKALHSVSAQTGPLAREILVQLQRRRCAPGLHRKINQISDAREPQGGEGHREN